MEIDLPLHQFAVASCSLSQLSLPCANTGSCLLAADSPNTEVTIATTVINDDICGVSFAYAVSSPPMELVVMVDGLGVIWSTLAAPVVSGWANRTLQIDLQDVQIMENRSMSYVARFTSSGVQYAALDNITLHPCTDCATPGKVRGRIP